jgi:hypothetical protein
MSPTAQRIAIAEACGYKLYSEQRGEYLLQYCLKPGDRDPWLNVQFDAREKAKERYKMLPWSAFEANRFDGWRSIPDYLNDLNAMHEALEKCFSNRAPLTRHQWWQRYFGQLSVVLDIPHTFTPQFDTEAQIKFYNATAGQRAAALLKTLDLWDDTK